MKPPTRDAASRRLGCSLRRGGSSLRREDGATTTMMQASPLEDAAENSRMPPPPWVYSPPPRRSSRHRRIAPNAAVRSTAKSPGKRAEWGTGERFSLRLENTLHAGLYRTGSTSHSVCLTSIAQSRARSPSRTKRGQRGVRNCIIHQFLGSTLGTMVNGINLTLKKTMVLISHKSQQYALDSNYKND